MMMMIKSSILAVLPFLILVKGHDHHHHHHHDGRHLLERNDDDGDNDDATNGSIPRCGTREPTAQDRDTQRAALEIYARRRPNHGRLAEIVVPVCFHVIAADDDTLLGLDDGAIRTEQLQAQLDVLNTAFEGTDSCCDQSLDWCNSLRCSANTGFSFRMAALDNETGLLLMNEETITTVDLVDSEQACVTRTTNNEWAYHNPQDEFEFEMKETLRKGGQTVLNAYFVPYLGSLGYTYLPWSASLVEDGVVVRSSTLPGGVVPFDRGATLVHETGHWMGLLHTFAGGCSISDGIFDTPPTSEANLGWDNCINPGTKDSCPSDDFPDPVFNFMDYSDDACLFEFTPGQAQMMQASWDLFRLGNGISERAEISLTRGVWSEPTDLLFGESQVYRVTIEGIQEDTVCTTDAQEGNAQLYVSIDQAPTFTDADCCVSDSIFRSVESCGRVTTYGRGRRWRAFLCQFRPIRYLFCRAETTCYEIERPTTLYAGVTTEFSQPVLNLRILCA